MDNRFELTGQIVSYGKSNGRSYLDIFTSKGGVYVFLENDNIDDLERRYDLQECTAMVSGYLMCDLQSEDCQIFAVATYVLITEGGTNE